MRSERTTPPSKEPVDIFQAKGHLNIYDDEPARDRLIDEKISAARDKVERDTGRALINQSWSLWLDCFPVVIALPVRPVVSITEVTYIDPDGNEQTLDPAIYRRSGHKLHEAFNQDWPDTRAVVDAVKVEYVAGYGADGELLPESLSAAVYTAMATLFEHRESAAPVNIRAVNPVYRELIWPYQVTLL